MLLLEGALVDWDAASEADLHRSRSSVVKALAAAKRMNDLLHNILAMVNVDSGAMVVQRERVALAELLTRMLERERFDADVTLDVRSDGPVDVDPFHVRQVVSNLVTNAVRHGMPPVSIDVAADEHTVCMTVRDAGSGVPDSFAPHLFERFVRPGTSAARSVETTTSAPGSGFGLYMVRELVQANGGTIAYRPASPRGAEFSVRFPRAGSGGDAESSR